MGGFSTTHSAFESLLPTQVTMSVPHSQSRTCQYQIAFQNKKYQQQPLPGHRDDGIGFLDRPFKVP